MPANLIIPRCEQNPVHPNHPPPQDKPLRIQILGLNKIIDQLFGDGAKMPSEDRPITSTTLDFDEVGLRFAKMAFKQLYGRDVDPNTPSDFVPRYQYNTFHGKVGECQPWEHVIDGYGITFDHLVSPADDDDPETLMINVCDPSDPKAAPYIRLDLGQYNAGPESFVLLVPRCCQLRRGTTDRRGINGQVREAREHLRLQSSGEAATGTE
ncbi:hypothetical protein GGS23DRAFT_570054 [Durotheca rogersii]|uniref:uncharacterized protein n=1 Tax=Durotheca rogersii TaxID=419775 RepID=UPI00221F4E16|nr:uncharacterized protein GGS23DRAFT_570054 [Durotheca rogersii]KAI5862903.1 hypothetical protein GGS23DRAFT_570054 [Durotheca rogersii]